MSPIGVSIPKSAAPSPPASTIDEIVPGAPSAVARRPRSVAQNQTKQRQPSTNNQPPSRIWFVWPWTQARICWSLTLSDRFEVIPW